MHVEMVLLMQNAKFAVKKMQITVTKEFKEAFSLCMKHYECTDEEIEYERRRVRANYADAEICYLAVANNIRNGKV